VRFTFTSQAGSKFRPAVILSDSAYHASKLDAVMVPLTSQQTSHYGDTNIVDWQQAGLLKASIAKGSIQTIERSSVSRRVGTLTDADLANLKLSLKRILGL